MSFDFDMNERYASCYSLCISTRPSVSEKVTYDNYIFKELIYNNKYLSRDIGTNDIRICTSNYPNRTVETTL